MYHESKEGKLFEDPVTKEKFLVYKWFRHHDDIIRAVIKTPAHECPMCGKWIPSNVKCCIDCRHAYAQEYDDFG